MDFSSIISIDKLQDGLIKWSNHKNNYDQYNPTMKINVDKFFDYLYSNALFFSGENSELLFQIFFIAEKYSTCSHSLNMIDLQDEINLIESKTIGSLSIPGHINCSMEENLYAILNSLCNKYKTTLVNLLSFHSRENLLKSFYMNASIVSYISAQAYNWKTDINIEARTDISYINLISETFSTIYEKNKNIVSNFFGSEKKSFEYLIHFILNSQVDFAKRNNETIEIREILKITRLLISTEQLRKNLPYIYEIGGTVKLENNQILVEGSLNDKIHSYLNINNEKIINIQSEELREIYKEFEKKRGYSPFLLEEYLYNYDTKFLETRTLATLIEEDALIEDIYSKTKQSKLEIINMLGDLTLKPTDENNIYTIIFRNDNRLFRTPLIKVSNYFLISFFVLIESAIYFRYRILKNELDEKLDKKTKNLVKEKFDEIDIKKLRGNFEKRDVHYEINYPLNQQLKCKHLFENKKGIPQEIDCYFIKNKKLYIMELKNRDFQRNLHEISRAFQKNKKTFNWLK
ncbi:hypothetical protein [Paenibacillus polymyxa]|uniref:hypothetical protein n=1 Tax=Paenibacillus polymyxa TaxID=1406 RepID=UPI0025B66539|nr:hypothetical protein [Paenibacillus polymyxa]MDN4081438.1 hypothetical protein [Paenibacillus polymyxa]MDN4109707.1 hypothetical protein [Paenibacillus polymyxa]